VSEAAFLLDSNILIYLLEGSSPQARAEVQRLRPGEVVTSAVAYAEVMRKVPPGDCRKEADVQALFSVIDVLPFGADAARAYRELPFRRGTFDRLIAAHALALGLIFVTNNERHFKQVPGLKIANWTKP
jgi:tRNA(fMet)-specific endonuclease VapC